MFTTQHRGYFLFPAIRAPLARLLCPQFTFSSSRDCYCLTFDQANKCQLHDVYYTFARKTPLEKPSTSRHLGFRLYTAMPYFTRQNSLFVMPRIPRKQNPLSFKQNKNEQTKAEQKFARRITAFYPDNFWLFFCDLFAVNKNTTTCNHCL